MEEWLNKISPCPRIIGEAGTRPGWLEAMRIIYDHELVLFSGCSYLVDIEGEQTHCSENSFIIVPPGKRHLSRESDCQNGFRRWVHFDWIYSGGNEVFPVMTYFPAKPEEDLFHCAPDFVPRKILSGKIHSPPRVFELFERLLNRWKYGTTHSRITCRGLLLELLLELLSGEREDLAGPYSLESQAASRIRHMLDAYAEKPMSKSGSIQQTLEETGKSYAHQCRIFKKHYGVSPLVYVNALRAARARSLLKDTELGISEIAYKLGFENLGYFTRFFKKYSGMSPVAYRRS